ncbi:MAG: hypothetical protein ACTSQZ_08745 [Candidatus Thorarchaeota archaeon]
MNTKNNERLVTLCLILGALASISTITIFWIIGLTVLFGSLLGALYFKGVFGPQVKVNKCKLILFLLLLNLANTLVILYFIISMIFWLANLPPGLDVMIVAPPIGSLILGIVSVALLIYSYRNCISSKTTLESI